MQCKCKKVLVSSICATPDWENPGDSKSLIPPFVMSPGWYFLCPTCGQKDNLPFTTLVDWIKKAAAESDSSWQHVTSEDAEMESVENSSQASTVQDEATLQEKIQ